MHIKVGGEIFSVFLLKLHLHQQTQLPQNSPACLGTSQTNSSQSYKSALYSTQWVLLPLYIPPWSVLNPWPLFSFVLTYIHTHTCNKYVCMSKCISTIFSVY